MYYNKWPKKQYLQKFLCFIEHSFDMKMLAPLTDRTRLLELVEYALDIRCTDGDVQDKADHKMTKGFLFEQLATIYKKMGSRLAPLSAHFAGGYIKWGVLGHYEMEVQSDTGGVNIALTCKSLGKKVHVDKEILGDDAGPFELSHNYSIKDAYIMSPSDKYICQNFFPALARKIKQEPAKMKDPSVLCADAGHQQEATEDAKASSRRPELGDRGSPAKKAKPSDERRQPKQLLEEIPGDE